MTSPLLQREGLFYQKGEKVLKGGRVIDKELKNTFNPESKSVKKHSVSHPVLRYEDGKFWIAVFAFFYSKEEVKSGMIPRPEYYALADIETGEIIHIKKSINNEFSNASYKERYSINMKGINTNISEEKWNEIFVLFDEARQYMQRLPS